jgi:uncharacterized membrane protein YoaK (UPF0700 family)
VRTTASSPDAATGTASQWRGGPDEPLFAATLSAVAGYVDTAGFLALFGMFPAHLTGNLVSAGAAMSTHLKVGVGTRLAMIPFFMAAVAVSALVARRARAQETSPVVPLLGLMTVSLAVFCLTGVFLHRFATGADTWAVLLIGGAAVAAMGVQNALMREALGSCCATTVMTGNLTQFTIDLVDVVISLPGSDAVRRASTGARLFKFGLPVAGFLIGAIAGGGLTTVFGLSSIALPTAVSALLTGAARRGATAPEAEPRRRDIRRRVITLQPVAVSGGPAAPIG